MVGNLICMGLELIGLQKQYERQQTVYTTTVVNMTHLDMLLMLLCACWCPART